MSRKTLFFAGFLLVLFGSVFVIAEDALTTASRASASLSHDYNYNSAAATPQPAGLFSMLQTPVFADAAFERVWKRTDLLVEQGSVARSWYWGFQKSGGLSERYDVGAQGQRLVQYFDKGRMEINNPQGDRNDPYFVTSGLLSEELITGDMQVGNSAFIHRYPACINIVGDPVDVDETTPTYASFRTVVGVSPGTGKHEPNMVGQRATNVINRGGKFQADAGKGSDPETTYSYFEPITGHNIPRAFWNFLHLSGPVIENGSQISAPLSNPWFFYTGLPISDAYWASVKINGAPRDVLIQVFERRVLSYTPSNASAWRVEMSNIGQHYHDWRYLNAGSCSLVGGCKVFPDNNVWNAKIVALPTVADSGRYIASLKSPAGTPGYLHPDFGAFDTSSGTTGPTPVGFQPRLVHDGPQASLTITASVAESDPGPYVLPPDMPVQQASDAHAFALNVDKCMLYEFWRAAPHPGNVWTAASAARFDLSSNAPRVHPITPPQTSADAAGLPMLPGFIRYDEITGGEVTHALSFTSFKIRYNSANNPPNFIWPARHFELSVPDVNAPPMGSRLRLKQTLSVAGFSTPLTLQQFMSQVCVPYDNSHGRTGDCEQIRIILVALQQFGMILHDGGGTGNSTLGITGTHNTSWNNDILVNVLRKINVSNFEVVDAELLRVQPPQDSMETRPIP